ncbi:MAG: hypothetical protein R8K20_05530 [Gallionellaceae bacterium]
MRSKSEAATKAAAKTFQGVKSEADSSLTSLHIKQSKTAFSIYSDGRRIASAFTRGAAIRLALQVTA